MHKMKFDLPPFFYRPRAQRLLRLLLAAGLFLATRCVFADANGDMLQGTDTGLLATLNGTGKVYIYLVELVVALAAYIKTKNIMALLGVVVIAVFINVVLTISGANPGP